MPIRFMLIPINYEMNTRHREKFKVTQCKTKRLQKSAIPYMQKLLNLESNLCYDPICKK